MRLEFFAEAGPFLALVGPWLAADPVRNTVLATVAHGYAGRPAPTDRPLWFAAVLDDESHVVGTAMRSAPEPPHRGYLAAMPSGGGALLAEVLHARGESMPAVNGDLDACHEYASRLVELDGGRVTVDVRVRQFEARAVRIPPAPVGGLHRATVDDIDLLIRLHREFAVAADEQAGRVDGGHHVLPTPDELRPRLEAGGYWFWLDEAGDPVHFTAVTAPAFGVCRVGPVYTPVAHRGRGIAGHVVGLVTQRILDQGYRACLFTDQANPTSNALYQSLGYEALGDTVELSVEGE